MRQGACRAKIGNLDFLHKWQTTTKKDYYEILGVKKSPPPRTSAGIPQALRANIIRTSSGDKTAEEKFKALSEANDVLSIPRSADLRPTRLLL